MADSTKYMPINGNTVISDLKSIFSLRTRRRVAFAYGFMFAFVIFTIFLTFNPPSSSTSPWFSNIFSTSSSSFNSTSKTPFFSTQSNRSHYPSIFSFFFPNSTQSPHNSTSLQSPTNITTSQNKTISPPPELKTEPLVAKNETKSTDLKDKVEGVKANQSKMEPLKAPVPVNRTVTEPLVAKNETKSTDLKDKVEGVKANQSKMEPPKAPVPVNRTVKLAPESSPVVKNTTGSVDKSGSVKGVKTNLTSTLLKKKGNEKQSNVSAPQVVSVKQGSEDLLKGLMNCDLFDGEWVRDHSYPLYKPGSCSLIDEQFNCFRNGRPDKGYQQYKWKPKGCTLPRLDGGHMLELLRGKRLVFVGDSLNRNMWESLVCILRNSVKDHSKVYEASGKHHFRSEASYSFVFKDYNCTVEFFVSPFLVHEWEIPEKNGKKKETLRLDLIAGSAENYKNADIIIFNTGHWWTHDKTSKGKDYYQEGSHIYGELNVLEAFRKALTTWARWVDAKVNPAKSLVFFRGYSASHFSGGQWNSGGQCDHETEPIKNHTYLSQYPPKMRVLEKVIKNMKTRVSYLNITRLTDYRKDGHPSVYRKLHYSAEERKSPQRFQDCSHWCLPGVPDAWNEILYAELLIKQNEKNQHQQQKRS